MNELGPTAPSPKGENRNVTDPIRDFEAERARSSARRALFGIDSDPTDMIGRYRIDRRIGEGGMGEVYRGVDPELDRRVAIKLVLPHLCGDRGQQRLRREARALARLSHPNVVQVYEVGEHQGRTFLAMEFVEGGTLTDWLRDKSHRWAAILERFVAAGHGLAAAHAAEIIHRDFKPDNVLMTVDGRCRVADFGLAFTDETITRATEPDPESEKTTDPKRVEERLSAVGSVLGTMRYMPLEQLRGDEVDARADQFAFCVALYEALWSQPPFPITTMVERLDALEDHEVITPPGAGVPRSVWRVLRRGLARDPELRWPSMESLLAALQAIGRRRRRLAIAAVTAPLAGLLVVLGRASEPATTPIDPCIDVRDTLSTLWGSERGEALEQAFEATALPFAPASATATRAGLDDWSERWLDQREQLCRATVSEQVPGEVLGLRGACLDGQREHFDATVTVLLDADAQAVTRALEPVVHLPEPSDCSNDEQLLLGVRPPPAAQAEPVAELRRLLARSQAERLAGHPDQAAQILAPTLATAESLAYRPALAEALAENGEVEIALGHRDAGIEQLGQAVDLAEATRHDRLAARIWLDLVWQVTHEDHDQRRGQDQLRRAEAANERIGVDSLARARLEFLSGLLAELAGSSAHAEAGLRAALTELEQGEHPAAPLVRPAYLGHLARLVAANGRTDEALALRREALKAAEQGFGPTHPEVAIQAFSLGQALQAANQREEAAVQFEHAASLWLAGPYASDPDFGLAQLSQVQVALAAGDLEQAERHAHEAEALFDRSLPPTHPRHGDVSMALAVIAQENGTLEVALRTFDEAARRYEQSLGADAPILASVQLNAALVLLELERFGEAKGRFESVLEAVGSGPHIPNVRFGLVIVALHEGNADAAQAQLDAIAEYREDFGPDERAEYALLSELTRLRRTGGARRLDDGILAILGTPDHELHDYLWWLARLSTMTDAEGRRLGIDSNPTQPATGQGSEHDPP